jgi:hypothetical protein
MKKAMTILAVVLAVFFASSVISSAGSAGSILIKKNMQIITIKKKNGELQGIISKDGPVKLKNISAVLWNSDKVGWNENSLVGGSIIRKTKNKVVFKIKSTPNNDWGGWTLATKDADFLWLNVDEFSIKGLPWEKVDNKIRYGSYEKPNIVISSPGTATIYFNSNMISGFVSDIIPTGKIYIYWNSDLSGWSKTGEKDPKFFGEIKVDNLGNKYCEIAGLPNNDKGTFTAKLEDGTFVWLDVSKWGYSSNIVVNESEGQLEYITAS